jgi:REP element-mobilizing transposase RayT
LRAACLDVRQCWAFRIDALAMLRDHLHAIWTLLLFPRVFRHDFLRIAHLAAA